MLNLDSECEFTWMWGRDFHLQAEDGRAYLWSSPDYGGDNTIRPHHRTISDYGRLYQHNPTAWGRDKGQHRIRDYCGNGVIFVGM